MRKTITMAAAVAIAAPTAVVLPVLAPAQAQSSFQCIFEPEYKGSASYTYLCSNTFETRSECEQQLVAYRDIALPIGVGAAGTGGWGRGGSAVDDYMTGMVEAHVEEQDDGSYYLQLRV